MPILLSSHALPRLRRSLVVLAVSAAAAGAAAQTAAPPADAAQHRYHLPAAPVANTLQEIARASGRRIVVDAAAAAGVRSGAVDGTLTVDQAIARALAGTELTAGPQDDGSIWVTIPAKLGTVLVAATRDPAETSFKADRSDTATRSGTSLMDVPQSVTIITGKVLESQQALSVRDALANVSSMAFTQSPQGSPTFSIRGYSSTAATVNGVEDRSASLTNVFGVERIEVLKGPQAILAGANSLGGGVNVVTKKPQADPIRSLQLQYGSHGDKTVAGDLGGALTDSRKLSYRLIASKSDARSSQGGFDGREDGSVLAQLRWKDETTDLIAGLSYGKQYQPPPLYTFARRDGRILPAPAIRQGNRQDGFDSEQKRAFYQLEQKIGGGATFVSRLQRSLTGLDLHLRSPSGLLYDTGAANDSPNGKVTYYGGRSHQDAAQTSGDHYFRIDSATGPVAHKLSVGINHSSYDYRQTEWSGASVSPVVYPADTSYVFPDLVANAQTLSSITNQTTDQVGLFGQDLLRWGDWSLLLNLRRTRYTSKSTTNYVSINYLWDNPKTEVWTTTPGGGLIYNLTPETSLYASYAEGFVPQATASCTGGLVDPITTRNRELGAKFDLLDGKLSLTTAAFELAQSNTLNYDSINRCYNVRDSQVTRGLELDIQGQPARGWNLILNYTYSTLKDVGNQATVYYGQAKHKASLWTTYDFPAEDQWWKGLGVGFGVTAASRLNGTYDATYPFTIPGQAQFDASLFYTRDKWSVIFGVKNIADRLLYGVSSSSAYIPVLEGRTFLLTVRHSFE
ncbi:TonB-dependent siderophore receptor [Xylophilus sp.]|uniref:TonB-dependent siderophore receptor n=1 Tax=Xylophilus sp. TaxID=2653893 RepID=UPI0013B6C8B7|nr:TonB-dependent receptor [Xylophilus sp.]KAF1043732.1 MAG: Ferric-pseudobactin 358 receptor [Xylophilus sp.]